MRPTARLPGADHRAPRGGGELPVVRAGLTLHLPMERPAEGLTQMSQEPCSVSVHRDTPACPSIPPSLLSPSVGWGIEDFSPLPSPFPLQRGSSVLATFQITATSSSVMKPLQEGDISQANIFFSSGRRGLVLHKRRHFLRY